MNFTIKSAKKRELDLIKDWSDMKKCFQIRNTYYFPDEYISLDIKKDVETLESMFNKYDSNLDKNKIIYRGLSFSKKNDDKSSYYYLMKEALKSVEGTNNTISIDLAPSSFTKSKDVAENEFGKILNQDYYSIIYKLTKRYSNEIDIKDDMTDFAYQKEIIIRSQKAKYKVLSIVKKNYDTIIIEIVEEESQNVTY